MIVTINEESYIFQERGPLEVFEFKDRYEIHAATESIEEQNKQLDELYRWLRIMVANGKFREQCAACAIPETVYIFKKPLRVILEQNTALLHERGKPRFPLRG